MSWGWDEFLLVFVFYFCTLFCLYGGFLLWGGDDSFGLLIVDCVYLFHLLPGEFLACVFSVCLFLMFLYFDISCSLFYRGVIGKSVSSFRVFLVVGHACVFVDFPA